MGSRIMAVDDNPVVTMFIAAILGQAGHEVETADSAADALVTLSQNPAELIILDLEMPGLDGLGLLRVLKERRLCEGVPILLLTAQNDSHFVTRARALGASGYLTKPVEAHDLNLKVERLLTDRDTVWLDDYHTVTRRPSAA